MHHWSGMYTIQLYCTLYCYTILLLLYLMISNRAVTNIIIVIAILECIINVAYPFRSVEPQKMTQI